MYHISVPNVTYSHSVKLLSLIFELARNSITYMYQIVQMKALELIGNLLNKVRTKVLFVTFIEWQFKNEFLLTVGFTSSSHRWAAINHFWIFSVNTYFRLYQSGIITNLYHVIIHRYLSNAPYGNELLQQIVEHLILNSRLWKKADKKVGQCTLSL